MELLQWTTIIQIITFLTYIGFIVYKYGILESISASWYALPKQWKPLFWLFTVILGMCMLPLADYHSLFFLSGAGLIFVGTAAAFEDQKMTNRVHYSGAVAGIGGAIGALFILLGTLVPIYITLLFLVGSLLLQRTHIIWWVEIGAFIGIVWGLIKLTF